VALAELPPYRPRVVACPIFGDGPRPVPPPPPPGLPPGLLAISVALCRALSEPTSAPSWPLVNTAGIDRMLSRRGGRRVNSTAAERVAGALAAGLSERAAAKAAGVSKSTAHRIAAAARATPGHETPPPSPGTPPHLVLGRRGGRAVAKTPAGPDFEGSAE
jgi:hypothetical protein